MYTDILLVGPKSRHRAFTGIFYICVMHPIKIAVHGGAGTMPKRLMTPEIEKACHNALQNALQAGYELMKNGGSAVDAVEAAVMVLENFELFNANTKWMPASWMAKQNAVVLLQR